jgi:hypothetical protein
LQARLDLTARFDAALVFGLFFNEAVPYRSQGLRFPVGKVVVLLGGLSRLLDRFVQRLGIGRSTCTWTKKGMVIFMIFQDCTCSGRSSHGRINWDLERCEWRPCLRMFSKTATHTQNIICSRMQRPHPGEFKVNELIE